MDGLFGRENRHIWKWKKSSCFAGLLPTCQQNAASVPRFHCSQQELQMVKVCMAGREPYSLRAARLDAVPPAFIPAPGWGEDQQMFC